MSTVSHTMRGIALDLTQLADDLEAGRLDYHDLDMGYIERRRESLRERTRWAFLSDPDLPADFQ